MKTFIKIGDVMKSENYGLFEVISRTVGKITIRFLDTGYVCTYDKNQVRKGNVKDCLVRSIYGVGFYGDGAYTGDKPKDIVAKALESWHSMFKRCYDTKLHKRGPSYIGCTAGEAWHNFQNYAKFYIEDAFRQEGWELDKDLLVKGNKVYCPENCTFLPIDINGLLKTNQSRRGEHPIGVFKCVGGFKSRCRDINGVQVVQGKFTSVDEAFEAYKIFKEGVVRQKAEYWKDSISEVAYAALVNYRVEITD